VLKKIWGCEGNWSAKFILQRQLEYKIYFAKAIGVQNLFCKGNWSTKFILQRQLEYKIYFAKAIGVQNLFCKGQD